MICQTCKDQVHEKCPGGTWCDCGHRAPVQAPGPGHEGAAMQELVALIEDMDADGRQELRQIGQAIEAGDYVITARPDRTTMSPEEYAQALVDLAEIRERQQELR